MQAIEFIVPQDLAPYINCVMVQENPDPEAHFSLPLYADGFPGIMFQQAENGFYLLPREKRLSELFLFGQTLEPVALKTDGPFRFVVFQLYPFASRYLLGVDPRELNDDCYDLLQLQQIEVEAFRKELVAAQDLATHTAIISELMRQLIATQEIPADDTIQQAIRLILQHEGQLTVKEWREQLYLTERTFERKFMHQVGLSPKQFARIIQFQTSLSHLNEANYDKLVEIGLESGFADQSHFIRTFRKYTGQTPSFYLEAMRSS